MAPIPLAVGSGDRGRPLGTLALVGLLFVAVTLWWLHLHTAPPTWDESNYLETSELLFQSIREHSWHLFRDAYVGAVFGTKAPLIAVLTIPACLVVGSGRLALDLTLAMLVAVLCCTTYLMSVSLTGSRWHGVGAVLFTNTMPIVYGLSHAFLVDYTLMIFMTAWIWLQVRSDGGRRIPQVIGLGAVLGLGTLTKISFPAFVIGPVVWGLWLTLRRDGWTVAVARRLAIAGTLVVLVAAGVAATWYLPDSNYRGAIAHAIDASSSTDYATYGVSVTLAGLVHYAQDVLVDALSIGHGLLFVILAVVAAGRRLRSRRDTGRAPSHERGAAVLLVAWPLLLFALSCTFVVKDPRYLVLLFPLLGAALSWLLVASLRGVRMRVVLAPLAFVIPVAVMMLNSLPFGDEVQLRSGRWRVFGNFMGFAGRPVQEHWPQQAIIRAIADDAALRYHGLVPLTLLLPNTIYFNQHNFRYYATVLGVNRQLAWSVVNSTQSQTPTELDERIAWMEQSSYLVTKTGDQGPVFTSYHSLEILKMLQAGELPFEPWLQVGALPDGSEGVVYRKRLGDVTRVMKGHAITRRGTIVSWVAGASAPDALRLNIWRLRGGDVALVGESTLVDAHAGTNAFVLDAPIDVLPGDHIGVYSRNGAIEIVSDGDRRSGDDGVVVTAGEPQTVPFQPPDLVLPGDLSLSLTLEDAAPRTTARSR